MQTTVINAVYLQCAGVTNPLLYGFDDNHTSVFRQYSRPVLTGYHTVKMVKNLKIEREISNKRITFYKLFTCFGCKNIDLFNVYLYRDKYVA